MGSDASKTATERAELERLICAAHLDISTIEKLDGERMPDFKCLSSAGEEFAFEVTSICAPEVAQLIATGQAGSDGAIWTADPTRRIVCGKLHKSYNTPLPIDLLCYWDGRTVSWDELIIAEIEKALLEAGKNPFRRIWFHGEDGAKLLRNAS